MITVFPQIWSPAQSFGFGFMPLKSVTLRGVYRLSEAPEKSVAQKELTTQRGSVWSPEFYHPEVSSLWGQTRQRQPCDSWGTDHPSKRAVSRIWGMELGRRDGASQCGPMPQTPDLELSTWTPAYRAHLCPCPPGISLLCPAASCLWAHMGPKATGSPLARPPICSLPSPRP